MRPYKSFDKSISVVGNDTPQFNYGTYFNYATDNTLRMIV